MNWVPIPFEFVVFGLTLLGVGVFHDRTMSIAVTGTVVVIIFKVIASPFPAGDGWDGLVHHLGHEWVMLANIFCLLTGFTLLSQHFEKSNLPLLLPRFLPDNAMGGFILLILVFLLSGFLDNIAAALIGGAAAHQLFRGKVHVGYLAGLVTAANAGGSGSVIGDTTTTMMWLSGIAPRAVVPAYLPSLAVVGISGFFASRAQQKYSPILRSAKSNVQIDSIRLAIVSLMLVAALAMNITINVEFPEFADRFPYVGFAVWLTILLSIPARQPDWKVLPGTIKGTIFLLALVLLASMMPVDRLPTATWQSTLLLGFFSSVFDNIPLTAIAIKQRGYDWGFLAYSVGVGGSMIWFGSSAGVAIANSYPEARSVRSWVRHAWFIPPAYVVGFVFMLVTLGWHPASN